MLHKCQIEIQTFFARERTEISAKAYHPKSGTFRRIRNDKHDRFLFSRLILFNSKNVKMSKKNRRNFVFIRSIRVRPTVTKKNLKYLKPRIRIEQGLN